MPATANNIFTLCRESLQVAAQTVAPFLTTPDQVILGDHDWAATYDFFGNIQTTGPYLFILPPDGEANGFSFNADFNIEAHLVYGFNDNADYDWTAIDYILATLIKAWTTYSEFVKGGNIGPFKVAFQRPVMKPVPKADGSPQFVAMTRFIFQFPFVADQGA